MKKIITSLTWAFALLASSHAVEPAHQAALEKLFVALHMEEQYEISMTAGFEASLGGAVTQMPAEQQPKFKAAMEKVKDFMKAEMGWAKMKGEMVEIYAKKLTLDDIQAVLPLLEKPEFQKLVNQQIGILPDTVKLGAEKAAALQPQIMQIVQAEMSK